MAITQTLTALPAAPDPATDTPQAFSNKAVASVAAQRVMVTEINTAIGQINTTAASMNSTLAAASALAAAGLGYTFDTATGASDPGAGKLRLSSASQSSATQIYLDLIGADTNDYTSLLDTFDASTSIVKGTLTLRKQSDPRAFLTFSVTARAAPSGYRTLSVTPTGSSSANPFAAGDPLVLQFVRTGDQGLQGAAYSVLRVNEEYSTGTAGPSGPGGNGVSSTVTRVQNTVKANTIAGASVSGNQITLPAGQYEVDATAPASISFHRAYLYCVTDAAVVTLGSSESTTTISRSRVTGEFTITSAKVYELRHYLVCNSAGTSSLGTATSQSGQPEVYAQTAIRKLA